MNVHFPSSSPKEVGFNVWQHYIQLKYWVFRCHSWWGEDKMEAGVARRAFQQSSFKVGRLPQQLSFIHWPFFPSCLQPEHDIRCRAAIMWKQGNRHSWAEKCMKPGPLCWFPRAPITKNLRLSGLKQQKLVLSLLWKLEVWNQDFNRAMLPSESLGEDPPLPFTFQWPLP